MNMIKSISFVIPVLALILIEPQIVICSEENPADSVQTRLENQLAEVESRLSDAKSGLGPGIDWLQYGDTVLHIFATEQNLAYIRDIIDWLLRPIPHWELPSSDIRQFLKDSERMTNRSVVRLMVLHLLLVKAPIETYSQPEFTRFLFDPMPEIRKRMIEVLAEDGTPEAIPALENAKKHLKSETLPNASKDEITLVENAINSIRLWDKRRRTHWKPDEEELHEQVEKILRLSKISIFCTAPEPPPNRDGPKYIIDRWARYKWAAKYILKSEHLHLRDKSPLVWYVIKQLDQENWNEALSWIIYYYNNHELDAWGKRALMNNMLDRASESNLHQLSYLLTSEDPADGFAIANLLRKYAEIGTEEHLPELRQALEFWKEKGKIGEGNHYEKAIHAIEQRLGIASEEDSDSSDTR